MRRTQAPRIRAVSRACRAAFATTAEISTSCPSTAIGGPPPSRLRPMPGADSCTTTPASSAASTTTVPTASRFAAAGIRAVGRGIRPFDHCPDRREVARVAEELY